MLASRTISVDPSPYHNHTIMSPLSHEQNCLFSHTSPSPTHLNLIRENNGLYAPTRTRGVFIVLKRVHLSATTDVPFLARRNVHVCFNLKQFVMIIYEEKQNLTTRSFLAVNKIIKKNIPAKTEPPLLLLHRYIKFAGTARGRYNNIPAPQNTPCTKSITP